MINCNDEEEDSLGFIDRLLERLHQADFRVLGSINVNIYKPGSQHVDRVENQHIGYPAPGAAPQRGGELPEALSTGEAMALWEKVQRAGYVDDNYQPLISRTQSALLADVMAGRLVKKFGGNFSTTHIPPICTHHIGGKCCCLFVPLSYRTLERVKFR